MAPFSCVSPRMTRISSTETVCAASDAGFMPSTKTTAREKPDMTRMGSLRKVAMTRSGAAPQRAKGSA
jgi:hypothetical protein